MTKPENTPPSTSPGRPRASTTPGSTTSSSSAAAPPDRPAAYWLAEADGTWWWWRRSTSPREDLRRRAHAPCGPPARRHGVRAPWPERTATTGCGRAPTGSAWSCPGPSTLVPLGGLRDHPTRPRSARGRAGRQGRRHGVGGGRSHRPDPRPSTAGPVAGVGTNAEVLPSCAGPGCWIGTRGGTRGAGPVHGGRRRGQLTLRPRPGHLPGPGLPLGMALRGYFRSPRHDEPFIESHLDIRNASGEVVPGYGWVFPSATGASTPGWACSRSRAGGRAPTPQLMDTFIEWAHRLVGLSPATLCGRPRAGSSPWACRCGPDRPQRARHRGRGGTINPFNGEGIAYGYETGRLAAACVARALSGEGSTRSWTTSHSSRPPTACTTGSPRVRPAHQQAGADACLRAHRHALPQRHGVAASHHGQPGAPR